MGRALALAILLSPLGLPATASAQDPGSLDDLINRIAEDHTKLAEVQQKVEKVDDDTDDLLAEYRATQRRIDALRTYNAQLDTLLASQQKELDDIRGQIDRVSEISREITPLMVRMLSALENFVELDVPFLRSERVARVARLREMMDRADVAESEKFRRLLEAYQIENDYGRNIEAYRDTIDLDGQPTAVEMLRVGRIALLYTTLDETRAGYYDAKAGQWKPLTAEARSELRKGLRMARKQAAPDLLRLPVAAPQEPTK